MPSARLRPIAFPITTGLLALLLGPELGWAQGPDPEPSKVRYRRDAKSTKAQSDLLDTKFEQAKQTAKKQRERGSEALSQEQFRKGHGSSPEMNDKQISFLERLIKSTEQSDPDYPDYLFRLADHYLERKSHFELQADSLYELIYQAADAGDHDESRQLGERQERYIRETKAASNKAAQVYQALADNPKFASYKRMDEALYFLAFELGQLGQEQEMQAIYQRLINDFPSSQYIPNAYLAFGDYYFEKGEIANAVRLYERVTQIKQTPGYAYALYKLGWCHLNPIGQFEARYDKSLDYFVATIDATNAGQAGSDAAGKLLRRDARRDLVRAYVHVGKPSKAWSLFTKVGNGPDKDEQDARRMMALLANQYFGDGQYVESTYVYTKLRDVYPDDPMACDWQAKIVVNTLATDNKDLQWRATDTLGAANHKTSAGDYTKSVKKRCRDATHSTMKQMATVWHDEAEKTQHPHTYELAKQAYEGYLLNFPSGPDHYEMQYFYAELLWAMATKAYDSKDRGERERGLAYFLDAHAQFVKTLELDPQGTFTVDAAYAQMLAMKNHLEYDETGAAKKSCVSDSEGRCAAQSEYPASEYSPEDKQMLAAYDTYTKYVKQANDEELAKISYHRVKLMMEHNRFDEAKPLLEGMIVKFDDVEGGQVYAAWCSVMLIDLLTIRWLDPDNDPKQVLATSAELDDWARKLQRMKVWAHPESAAVRAAVPNLLAGIGWKQARAHAAAGRAHLAGDPDGDPEGFEKCAAEFIAVFNNFEDHDKADTLLWNAAECLDAGYRVGQAIQIREALLERFPASGHAKETLHRLAESYQAVAYYDESAERYEQFAAAHRKDTRASDALQNAYLFRLGLGQADQAQADLGTYESLYKKKDIKRAAMIFWSQHDLLESSAARREHAVDYLKTYTTQGGIDRAVVAEAAIGQIDWRRSCDEPLLHDACITIERKRVIPGVRAGEAYRAKQAEYAQAKAKAERRRFVPPKHCGSRTQGLVTVHRRSSKRSVAAQARFDRILKLAPKVDLATLPTDDPKRAEDFKQAWAMAIVYAADQHYEQYLRLDMPEGLDFMTEDWRRDSGVSSWERKYKEQVDKAADSKQRVASFLDEKTRLGRKLQTRYAEVVETGSAHWILAAAARTAAVQQNFADQLYRAEIPQDFKTQEQVWAYCDALADYADPIQAQALAAYEYCLARSTQHQFFNEYSRVCEEELQQRDAQQYPATNELFGVSVYTASRVDNVGVVERPH